MTNRVFGFSTTVLPTSPTARLPHHVSLRPQIRRYRHFAGSPLDYGSDFLGFETKLAGNVATRATLKPSTSLGLGGEYLTFPAPQSAIPISTPHSICTEFISHSILTLFQTDFRQRCAAVLNEPERTYHHHRRPGGNTTQRPRTTKQSR